MSRLATLAARARDWALETEGSTRSAALIRIGLAMLIWARWAEDKLLYKDLSPERLVFDIAFFVATTAMFFGLFSRLAAGGAAALLLFEYFYVGVLRDYPAFMHHNTYLLAVATLLCSLAPCGASYSFDRWLALRRAERRGAPLPPERGNLWALRLIALQLCVLYFWTAFDKTSYGFLSGDRMEQYLLWFYLGSDLPAWSGFFLLTPVVACGTVALEYALAFGLLFAPTRRWLILPGLLLHGVFYMVLPVATFSLLMWLLYLAFFEADDVHRVIDRLSGVQDPRDPRRAPVPAHAS